MRKQKDESLLTDTLTHINSAVTNIYTKMDIHGDIGWDDLGWNPTPEQRELVDTFNELVTLEQKIIDMLHPMRHEDGKLPSPKYLYIERANTGFRLREERRDYQKSRWLYYKKRDLL
jgi:hypothetical protein